MPKKPYAPQATPEVETAAKTKRELLGGAPPLAVPAVEAESVPLAVSVVEVAQKLGLSRNGAYALVASGAIPSLRLGGRLLIPVRALDAMLNAPVEAWRQRQLQA